MIRRLGKSPRVPSSAMASHAGLSDIPVWDGDPNSFERFATACRWYAYGLKQSERPLAAPRVWNRLSGSAKSVVRNLDPEEYVGNNRLEKLLEVLRRSPLQKLPIPDSFQRLEKRSTLRSCLWSCRLLYSVPADTQQ